MSYKRYGVFAKNTSEGYVYILGQFANVKEKKYGVHYFKDPSELSKAFAEDYSRAKSITEIESYDRQLKDKIGMIAEGKRTRKRTMKGVDTDTQLRKRRGGKKASVIDCTIEKPMANVSLEENPVEKRSEKASLTAVVVEEPMMNPSSTIIDSDDRSILVFSTCIKIF